MMCDRISQISVAAKVHGTLAGIDAGVSSQGLISNKNPYDGGEASDGTVSRNLFLIFSGICEEHFSLILTVTYPCRCAGGG